MPEAEILPPEADFAPYARGLDTDNGVRCVPHPNGGLAAVVVREGLHLGWGRCSVGRALLLVFGGDVADLGFGAISSREGVRQLIGDLQSIDAQLDSA